MKWLLNGSLETLTISLNSRMVLERLTLTINDGAVVLWQIYMVLNYIQMVCNEIYGLVINR